MEDIIKIIYFTIEGNNLKRRLILRYLSEKFQFKFRSCHHQYLTSFFSLYVELYDFIIPGSKKTEDQMQLQDLFCLITKLSRTSNVGCFWDFFLAGGI